MQSSQITSMGLELVVTLTILVRKWILCGACSSLSILVMFISYMIAGDKLLCLNPALSRGEEVNLLTGLDLGEITDSSSGKLPVMEKVSKGLEICPASCLCFQPWDTTEAMRRSHS